MSIKVVERIETLCGETTFAGLPCALIRLAGCDLRCRWCDTVRAQVDQGDLVTTYELEDLIAWVEQTGHRFVLLTGGEPLLQPELPALASRLTAGPTGARTVLVETSGAHDIRPLAPPVIRCVDVKCPGSGEVDRNIWENLLHLRPGDVVKLVLTDRVDYMFAREVIEHYHLGEPLNILLSCAYPTLEAKELATWMLEDRLFQARLSPQLHKVFWPNLG